MPRFLLGPSTFPIDGDVTGVRAQMCTCAHAPRCTSVHVEMRTFHRCTSLHLDLCTFLHASHLRMCTSVHVRVWPSVQVEMGPLSWALCMCVCVPRACASRACARLLCACARARLCVPRENACPHPCRLRACARGPVRCGRARTTFQHTTLLLKININ